MLDLTVRVANQKPCRCSIEGFSLIAVSWECIDEFTQDLAELGAEAVDTSLGLSCTLSSPLKRNEEGTTLSLV